ncbi:hypothetical protein [Parageobacillus thermoglucosidasius]|uniref:hypothetical protein n=1 Tax=Parageobacillus thermoglucosidasius TaxID=1426 RepID=UPI0002E57767|nr:hypothetical protein [Parageobacillus thermoglucosidasius]RDE30493.1 hypothetical protein DV713_20170 [Parageobacillus thermoglucosidasius]
MSIEVRKRFGQTAGERPRRQRQKRAARDFCWLRGIAENGAQSPFLVAGIGWAKDDIWDF